jgi:4-amino-4-deoxy-L-arabinose transferase-like glycosyltransferase
MAEPANSSGAPNESGEEAALSSRRRPEREAAPHILTILVFALLARLLILVFVILHFPHDWLFSRGLELGILAQSLLEGHGLSSPFGGETGPTALLAPGYPAIIAVLFRIFGSFTFSAAIAIMTIQIVTSVITVLLITHIARAWFDARTANLAGFFWAVSLPIIWMPTIFWETCLSALLLLGMIPLAMRCERKPTWALWAIMGAYSGFAALVNPALLAALLAMLAWAAWMTRGFSRHSPILGLVVLVLVFSPWPIRNARELHAFIPLRSTIGLELWMGNHTGATGFLEEPAFPTFNKSEYDKYVSSGEVAYMQNKSELARASISANPIGFIRLSMLRFIRFWSGTGNRDSSPIFAIHSLLTTFLGFVGIWRLIGRRRISLAVLFSLSLILFPVPYYITHAEFRYRLVIDPQLTILAAYTVCEWMNSHSQIDEVCVSGGSC